MGAAPKPQRRSNAARCFGSCLRYDREHRVRESGRTALSCLRSRARSCGESMAIPSRHAGWNIGEVSLVHANRAQPTIAPASPRDISCICLLTNFSLRFSPNLATKLLQQALVCDDEQGLSRSFDQVEDITRCRPGIDRMAIREKPDRPALAGGLERSRSKLLFEHTNHRMKLMH